MGIKVAKFGGSSLSDAGQFEKVRAIILMDPERAYCGANVRRAAVSTGMTRSRIFLYRCHKLHAQGKDYQNTFDLVAAIYMDIAEELALSVDLGRELDDINEAVANGATRILPPAAGNTSIGCCWPTILIDLYRRGPGDFFPFGWDL